MLFIFFHRYLASGDSQRSISYAFRVGKSTTSAVIKETINALWSLLKEKVLPAPNRDTWLESSHGFNQRWNFPNCIGAIDGKHIRIQVSIA